MKRGICGSLESNDVLMTVEESNQREIMIQSIVYEQFKEAIEKAIVSVLDDLQISKIKVYCNDKGALDYTIQARLRTAIERMEKSL